MAGVEALHQLSDGQLPLNPTLLAIPAFFGLLRFSDGWRRVALAIEWMGAIIATVTVLAGLGVIPASSVKIFGTPTNQLPASWTIIAGLLLAAVCAWQIRTLMRADIRKLFTQREASRPNPATDYPAASASD